MGKAKGEQGKQNKQDRKSQRVNFFRSIRFKIILAVLLPVCFIVVLGVVCYRKASEGIIQSFRDSSEQAVSITSEYFNFMMDSILKDYHSLFTNEQLNSYLSGTLSGFPEQMVSIYNTNRSDFVKRLTGAVFLSNIYIVSDEVDSIATTYPKSLSLYSALAASEAGQLAEGDPNSYFWFGTMPQLDEAFGTSEELYALRLVRKFKKADAFLAVDISRKAVMDVLNQLELGEGAVWGLVTGDGKEVLTTGEGSKEELTSGVFTSTDVFRKLFDSEEVQLEEEIRYQGEDYLFLGEKVSDTGLTVCAMIPITTITALADGIKNLTFVIVLLASIIAIAVGLFISQGIGSTIKKMVRKINQAAKGDLTVQIHTRRKDEFALLAGDLTRMIAHTKHLIQNVESISTRLLSAAEKVTAKAGEYVTLADNIKQAADGIDSGVAKQAGDSGLCLDRMDELSGQIQVMTGETGRMGEVIGQAEGTIRESLAAMGTLTQKAQTTSEITQTVLAIMEHLEEKSGSISGIVKTIKTIATQTNLLSLNASIEAARAGEAGLGFAVVAEEIQKLAAQSSESAKQIYEILEELRTQMKEAAAAVQDTNLAVSEQETAVNETSDSFGRMQEQIGKLTEEISGILSNVSEMDMARCSTMDAVKSISEVAADSARASSTVAEAAKMQFSLVTGLNETSKQLLEYAGNLEESIGSFKVR